MKSLNPFLALLGLLVGLIVSASESFSQQEQAKNVVPPAPVVPEGVKAHRDLVYVENGHERHKLDLFVPEKADEPLPLIIWVHGGGWQNGSKEGCPPLRGGYTGRGYAVASINYRLSGHAVFPAQIEDCKAAIRWLRAHAKEYHLDPQQFGVWGSSAGGHLVSLLGTSGDVKEFEVGAHLDHSSRVQAVCDYYGPTDFTVFVTTPGYESHARAEAPEGKLIGGPVLDNKEKSARANPITFVSKDDPPFLIVHGDEDRTVPINQSQLLFAALKETGISSRFHTIQGAGHGTGFGGPEIEPMVRAFFEEQLKPKSRPSNLGPAQTSESAAVGNLQAAGQSNRQPGARPNQPASAQAPRGRGLSFDQILGRNDKDKDDKLSRTEFPGTQELWERLDDNKDGFVSRDEHERRFNARPAIPADSPKGAALPTGLLYFASYPQRDNPSPAANPHLVGGLFTIYWSDIEPREGEFDWSGFDKRVSVWIEAGKKFAIRIMWSSSGNWPEPAAKHPTPQFVLEAGAVTVHSTSSKTDIPLVWDPTYRKYANRFLAEVARKFDGDPNVLFVDVTPGAETNPYRFRRINVNEPQFKTRFAETAASDGRKYSHELWLETVKQSVDDARTAFKSTPLLVTLNVGSLDGPEQFQEIGEYCVSRGCYVGQNGLNGNSYNEESPRRSAFQKWDSQTKFYFETVDASGGNTGSLMEVMKAAERVGCDYLGVYSVDVLRGTKGQSNYDASFEEALAYGAKALGSEKEPSDAPKTSETSNPALVAATGGQENSNSPQATSSTAAQGANRGGGNAARDREPTWLMTPVEGPNLHYKTFDSKLVGQKVSYLLYLPPGYDASNEKRYPVVYWLHGIGGSQQGVPGMTARLTGAIESGKTPPFLMVFVNGMIRSSYVDSADGKYPVESLTIKELVPHIDATYRTIASREGRMIEGFSMGGGGAAKWGFKHTDVFGSISIVDGAMFGAGDSTGRATDTLQRVYGGDEQRFAANDPWKLAPQNADAMRGRTIIRILTGSRGLTGSNTKYHELLDSLTLAHDFDVITDAPHSPGPMYEGLGDKNWDFYRRAFARVATIAPSNTINPLPEDGARGAESKVRPTLPEDGAKGAKDKLSSTPQGFHQSGERWTYREGDFEMNGILLKPEGKKPFPILLISHGLGGTAESFGLNKAREMVKWGFVCIAPDYTHSAKFLSGQRRFQRNSNPKNVDPNAPPAAADVRRSLPPEYATYGASDENLRRAKTCIELVSTMPGVDATRIAAYGHSMGGFVTIGLAAKDPSLLRAAAFSGSGVAPQDGFPAPFVGRAEAIRTPFLMLHGSIDNTVRPEQSQQLKVILDKNNIPNERVVFEGENHPIDQSKCEDVFAKIHEWFTKHGVIGP